MTHGFRLPALRSHSRTAPVHIDDLSSLATWLSADDKNKLDITVTGGQIEFTDRKTLALPTKNGTEEFSFTAFSFAQTAKLLGIPAGYLEKCAVTGKGSMKDQIEAKLSERETKNHIIRLRRNPTDDGLAGTVRAVLPGSHTIFDYHHLVPAVRRAISEVGGGFEMQMNNATDPKSVEQILHMRFVRKQTFNFGEIEIDDPHQVGFHVQCSEVGAHPISLDGLIFRLVCKNGMMGWAEGEIVKISNTNLQHHEVTPQLAEGVSAALRQEAPIQRLLQQKYTEPVTNPENAIYLMSARMKVGDHIRERAMELLHAERKSSYSRFDVMQSFTQAAQALPMDERVKLELAIGRSLYGNRATPVARDEEN